MIREVGKEGILAFPDFTTVLSMNANARREVFNQLRVIYDGEAGLGTGIDTGRARTWQGKVAVVACVTEMMERFKERSSDLGERYLYYKYSPAQVDAPFIAPPDGEEARTGVPGLVRQFVTEIIPHLANTPLSEDECRLIFTLAEFIARGRAIVERDGYSRAIRLIHDPEQPYRIDIALRNLYLCLVVVNGGERERAKRIIREVCVSTVPTVRMAVIDHLGYSGRPCTQREIEDDLRFPAEGLRRTIEDLLAQGILCETDYRYGLDLQYAQKWRTLRM